MYRHALRGDVYSKTEERRVVCVKMKKRDESSGSEVIYRVG